MDRGRRADERRRCTWTNLPNRHDHPTAYFFRTSQSAPLDRESISSHLIYKAKALDSTCQAKRKRPSQSQTKTRPAREAARTYWTGMSRRLHHGHTYHPRLAFSGSCSFLVWSQGGEGFIPPHPRIRNIPFSFLPLTHLSESMTQTREPRRATGSTDNRSLYLFLRYIFTFLLFITRGYQPRIFALSSPDFRRHSSFSRLGIDCGGRGKLEVA